MGKLKFKPKPAQIRAWIEANFDYKTRKNGDEYLINSPFCDDTGYKFNISISKAIAHDWRGDDWAKGKSRTFLRFVQLYRNCSFVEAFKEVCGKDVTMGSIYAKLRNERKVEEEERKYDIALPAGSEPLADASTTTAKMLTSWLASRGINLDGIEKYNLYYHSMNVVWPYYEYDSLVYWQERNRLNKVFRFPSENVGVTKGMFLYGFDMVEPSDYVIVTEAIFDSITLDDQCIASGGAVLTNAQVKKIRILNPVNGVILSPDNDKAGIDSIISNYQLLSPYFNKLYYATPPVIKYGDDQYTKDWNDLGSKKVMDWSEIRDIFENSIRPLTQSDIIEFIMNSN